MDKYYKFVKTSEEKPQATNGFAKQLVTRWEFEGNTQLRIYTANQLLDLLKTTYDLEKVEWLKEVEPLNVEEWINKGKVKELLNTILKFEREITTPLRMEIVMVKDIKRAFDEYFGIKEEAPF